MTEKPLNILTCNANSIINKINELEVLANEENIDIICIQESKINNKNPPKINGYNTINKPNGPHHGLVTFVKKHISYTELLLNTVNCENITTIIGEIAIINVYQYPNLTINSNDLNTLFNVKNKTIICGDVNGKHQNWNNYTTNRNGNKLQNYIDNSLINLYYPYNVFTYHPYNVNCRPSVIDLVLAKNIQISSVEALNELNSDHLPVKFVANHKIIVNPTKYSVSTDWDNYRKSLESETIINNNMPNHSSIQKEITKLSELIITAFNKETTRKVVKDHNLKLPEDLKNLIREKNRLRRINQRTNSPQIKNYINELKNLKNMSINSIKSANWEQTLRKITPQNPRNLWRIAKALKRKNNSMNIPALQSPHGLALTDKEKADTLAETLLNTHKLTLNKSNNLTIAEVERAIKNFYKKQITTPYEDLTTPAEIKKYIKTLKSNKAPGEDKISNRMLKNIPRKTIIQLNHILNNCIKQQYFPNVWKNGVVLPFKKPNKNHSHPVNYRPISLLPTMGKLLERIILNRIKKFEDEHKTSIQEQFGFKANHSTLHQLARLTDIITTNFNIKRTSALLTLDIEKAFDTVWHQGLIFKLIKNQFPDHLIKIISSFLQNRTFQVRVANTLSNKYTIPAGVPQGAVLSPTLFNIFINDIPKHTNTSLALFADDTAILAESSKSEQCNIYLQRHVTLLEEYYH